MSTELVDIPPGDGLVGKYCLVWGELGIEMVYVFKCFIDDDGERVAYTYHTGKYKGMEFSSRLRATTVRVFTTKTEAQNAYDRDH